MNRFPSDPRLPFGEPREVNDVDRKICSAAFADRPKFPDDPLELHDIDGIPQSQYEEERWYGAPRRSPRRERKSRWDAFWNAALIVVLVLAAIVIFCNLGTGKGVI